MVSSGEPEIPALLSKANGMPLHRQKHVADPRAGFNMTGWDHSCYSHGTISLLALTGLSCESWCRKGGEERLKPADAPAAGGAALLAAGAGAAAGGRGTMVWPGAVAARAEAAAPAAALGDVALPGWDVGALPDGPVVSNIHYILVTV